MRTTKAELLCSIAVGGMSIVFASCAQGTVGVPQDESASARAPDKSAMETPDGTKGGKALFNCPEHLEWTVTPVGNFSEGWDLTGWTSLGQPIVATTQPNFLGLPSGGECDYNSILICTPEWAGAAQDAVGIWRFLSMSNFHDCVAFNDGPPDYAAYFLCDAGPSSKACTDADLCQARGGVWSIGRCSDECTPNCAGRQCGPDPSCGIDCGQCSMGTCNSNGACVPQACTEGTCTSAGTGSSLCLEGGAIPGGVPTCNPFDGSGCPTSRIPVMAGENICVCLKACTINGGCVPDCTNRQCGPDPSCGLDCGQCSTGLCSSAGICTSTACGSNSDCVAPEVCRNATCALVSCSSSAACGPGEVCDSSAKCVPSPSGSFQEQ